MPLNVIRPPIFSGLAAAVDLVTDELARRVARSHDVIAYCARGDGQPSVEQSEGVEYRRVSTWLDHQLLHRQKFTRLMSFIDGPAAPQPLNNSTLWFRNFISRVVSDLARRRPDIVHVMNISQFVPIIRTRLPYARIVLHMQCQWLEDFDAAVLEPRIRAADLVLGCSDFITSGVRRRFPSLAQRCKHIYNGVDLARFARPGGVRPKPKQLLYVGRIAPEKGVHVLLDAFRVVVAQHPDAHLELIGPKLVLPLEVLFPGCDDPHVLKIKSYFRPETFHEILRAKVSDLPSGSVSSFSSGLEFSELVSRYHSASIFAFPPICNDASPLTAYEASACGLPIVSTWSGGIPEIVAHERSGLLVERSDPQAVAGAILQLLSNPDQREAMAREAFERASTIFSWDRIAEDLLAKYEALFV